MAKYYVEFLVKTGYYIEAESQEEAIDRAYPFFEAYEPEVTVDYATEEEIETENFY